VVGAQKVVAGEPLMIPGLQTAISGWGVLCIGHALGYAWTVPLAVRPPFPNGAPMWPSMGLVSAFGTITGLEMNAASRQLLFQDTGGRIRQLPFSTVEALTSSQNACPALTKGSRVANHLIRLSPLSYWRNAVRRIPYQQLIVPDPPLRERLAGKIVLVGVTKMNTDLYGIRHRWRQEERHGVELHADVITNLISGVYVQPLSLVWQVFLMIGMAVLGALLALWQRLRDTIRRALLSLGIIVYLGVSVVLYAGYGVLLNVTYSARGFLFERRYPGPGTEETSHSGSLSHAPRKSDTVAQLHRESNHTVHTLPSPDGLQTCASRCGQSRCLGPNCVPIRARRGTSFPQNLPGRPGDRGATEPSTGAKRPD
jgi:hypothetical protein